MNPNEQVAQQRKILEEAVSQALEFAQQHCDAAEVAVNKSTGIGVSTRHGEVEMSNLTVTAH